ncbi:MAG: Flp family type IVb pilin [Acidimicrobiia bacterium]
MIRIYWDWFRSHLHRPDQREEGLTTVEYVVLGAVIVVGVATVASILVAKLISKANSINL